MEPFLCFCDDFQSILQTPIFACFNVCCVLIHVRHRNYFAMLYLCEVNSKFHVNIHYGCIFHGFWGVETAQDRLEIIFKVQQAKFTIKSFDRKQKWILFDVSVQELIELLFNVESCGSSSMHGRRVKLPFEILKGYSMLIIVREGSLKARIIGALLSNHKVHVEILFCDRCLLSVTILHSAWIHRVW